MLGARFTLPKCFFVEMGLPHVCMEFPSICVTPQTKTWALGDTVSIVGELQWARGPLEDQGRAHFGKAGVVCVCCVV